MRPRRPAVARRNASPGRQLDRIENRVLNDSRGRNSWRTLVLTRSSSVPAAPRRRLPGPRAMSTSAHSPSPPSLSSGSSSSDDSATRSPARPVPSHLPTLLFPASSNASSGTFVLHKSTLPSLSLGDPTQSCFASSDNAQSPRLPPAVDENIFGGVSLEARETAVRSERRAPGAATTRGRRLNGVYTNTPAAGSVSFPDPSTGLPPNGPRRAVGPSANTIADQIEAKVVIRA